MIPIVHEAINAYIEKRFEEKDPVLLEMEAYGEERDFPLVGPQVGRLLYMLTRLVGARRIFEFGSGFGYSAYWFARALPKDGKVIQTETRETNSKMARDFFTRGGLAARTEFLTGDALKLLDEVPGNFDIMFLDLDKENYPRAFKKAKDRLRPGGLLIADNALWFGRVVEDDGDPTTIGIQEFTKMLFADRDFFATIVPIRDGVAIAYKTK